MAGETCNVILVCGEQATAHGPDGEHLCAGHFRQMKGQGRAALAIENQISGLQNQIYRLKERLDEFERREKDSALKGCG